MPASVWHPDVQGTLESARQRTTRRIALDGQTIEISPPFPSPQDWRDQWIYFLMLDRFNNPSAPPQHMPYDAEFDQFQGGTYNGVRSQLKYLQQLGTGAIWLSPVLKNPQFDKNAYHGYGIQNFLAAEPRFASSPEKADSELRQLVDEAHELGMYVIFDIVLHHTGNVFAYALTQGGTTKTVDETGWRDEALPILWRDEHGNPTWSDAPDHPPLDAAVFPDELRHNSLFTRQGNAPDDGSHPFGDFNSLKGIAIEATEPHPHVVYNILIRSYH